MDHTYIGDHGPVKVMHNGCQIAGAVEAEASGTGRVEIGEGIYNAALPSVVVKGEGRQEKLTGKNLFDKSEITETANVKITNTGFQITNSYATNTVRSSSIRSLLNRIRGKTVTASVKWSIPIPATGSNGMITLLSARNTVPSIVFVSAGGHSRTVTIPNDIDAANYYGLYAYGIGNAVSTFDEMQIEEASTPTPYEPYCGGIPAPNPQYPIEPQFLEGASITDGANTAPLPILRALPDGSVRDEIDLRTGIVTRRIGVKMFDGSEYWGKNVDQGDFKSFYIDNGTYGISKNIRLTHICSHAECRVWNPPKGNFWWYTGGASSGMRIDKKYLGTDYDLLTTDADRIGRFKKWLVDQKTAGTPVTIWYPLATPIIEHYAPAILRQHPGYTQLIQQGGELTGEIAAKYYTEMER